MAKRKILVDDTRRELEEHGTETFPLTVNHDDLWMFEGKNVPIHWHQEIEISLPREGKAVYQIYQNSYEISPGDGLLVNRNVPHSCHSPNNERAKYTTILVRPDFLYGDFGSDVERNCFQPFLQNSAVPCLCIPGTEAWGKEVLEKLEKVDTLFYEKPYCYELKIKGLLCEAFFLILVHQQKYQTPFVPANRVELARLAQMLDYIHTHSESVISLEKLGEQVHLSREVCCRLFRKMTGKTVTQYLEEYRASKSLPLVESGFLPRKICYICLIACSISRSEAVTLILETIVRPSGFFTVTSRIVPSSIWEDARSPMNFTNFGWFWAKRSLRFFNSINFIGLNAILFSVLSIRNFFRNMKVL